MKTFFSDIQFASIVLYIKLSKKGLTIWGKIMYCMDRLFRFQSILIDKEAETFSDKVPILAICVSLP